MKSSTPTFNSEQVLQEYEQGLAPVQTGYVRDYDYLYKILMVGSEGVGKSNILLRYTDKEFTHSHAKTWGLDYITQSLHIDDKEIKTQVWNQTLRPSKHFRDISYKARDGIVGLIVCYDITSNKSFQDAETYIAEIQETVGKRYPILLVGNKSDKRHYREVPTETAKEFALKNKIDFLETSALDDTNIKTLFALLCTRVLQAGCPIIQKAKHAQKMALEFCETFNVEMDKFFVSLSKLISTDYFSRFGFTSTDFVSLNNSWSRIEEEHAIAAIPNADEKTLDRLITAIRAEIEVFGKRGAVSASLFSATAGHEAKYVEKLRALMENVLYFKTKLQEKNEGSQVKMAGGKR